MDDDGDELLMDGELYRAHDSHKKHKLRFYIKAPDRNYECHGCKMPGDFNPCFKCPYEKCPVYFHQLCYRLKPDDPEYQHLLFPHCVLKYFDNPPEVSNYGDFPYCDACGQDIKGFRYRCIQDDPADPSHPRDHHDLHPTCLHRKLEMTMNSGIKLELKDKVNSRCLECKKKYPVEECIRFTGWKWVSKKREYWGFPHCFTGTKICFHLKCMNDKLREGMK